MAQNRVLRSASKLRGVPASPLAKDTRDTCTAGAGKELAGIHESRDVSALAKNGAADASFITPSKKKKVEPARIDSRNLASETVSMDRPAGPHSTNAPLMIPRGSHVVAYAQEMVDEPASKTGVSRPATSTSQLLEQACAHLIRVDPRLQPLIEKYHCRLFSPEGLAEVVDPFQSLCSSIMAQQVSGAAASSIKAKFVGLFREDAERSVQDERFFPSPAQIAPCEVPFLRRAGLSERKAEYIKGLAQKFVDGELTATMLIKASDEEIIEKLTAVRGLGLWSVQMFACFGLKRTDIFSTGIEESYTGSISRLG